MKSNKIDGMEIIFLERILIPMYYLYEVQIINTGNKKIKYDMANLLCNCGINILHSGNNLFEYELLNSGELKSEESIIGYIAYEKVDTISSNQPSFIYQNYRFKVKDNEIKVKKVQK